MELKPSLNILIELDCLSANLPQSGCGVLPGALAAYDFVCVEGIFGAPSRGPLTSIFSSWADLTAPVRPSVQDWMPGESGRRLFLDSMTQRCRVKLFLSRHSDEVKTAVDSRCKFISRKQKGSRRGSFRLYISLADACRGSSGHLREQDFFSRGIAF